MNRIGLFVSGDNRRLLLFSEEIGKHAEAHMQKPSRGLRVDTDIALLSAESAAQAEVDIAIALQSGGSNAEA